MAIPPTERERPRDMHGSDADPKQKRCSQCGKRWASKPCGPTHAAVAAYRRSRKP